MKFVEALQQYGTLPVEAQDFLRTNSETITTSKNQVLVSIGQVCDYLFYVENGLIRAFNHMNGDDQTTFFAKEQDFMYLMEGFLGQEPSLESVETLEPSTITMVRYRVIQQLYDSYPESNAIGRLITQKYFWEYHQRVKMTYCLNVSDRFEYFMAQYADMLGRMPNKHIASYLGIRPETLSRFLSKKQGIKR